MTFEEILQRTIVILQSRGRVSYRALKRQFNLDDDYLDDLKAELLYAYPQVVDDGRGLAWQARRQQHLLYPQHHHLSPATSLCGSHVPTLRSTWSRKF